MAGNTALAAQRGNSIATNAIEPPMRKLKFIERTNMSGLAAVGVANGSPVK